MTAEEAINLVEQNRWSVLPQKGGGWVVAATEWGLEDAQDYELARTRSGWIEAVRQAIAAQKEEPTMTDPREAGIMAAMEAYADHPDAECVHPQAMHAAIAAYETAAKERIEELGRERDAYKDRLRQSTSHCQFQADRVNELEREHDDARTECERLRRQVDWLERNSVLKTPKQCSIQDYLNTRELPESSCPASDDGRHGEAWYDGEECSMCGDAALNKEPSDG